MSNENLPLITEIPIPEKGFKRVTVSMLSKLTKLVEDHLAYPHESGLYIVKINYPSGSRFCYNIAHMGSGLAIINHAGMKLKHVKILVEYLASFPVNYKADSESLREDFLKNGPTRVQFDNKSAEISMER